MPRIKMTPTVRVALWALRIYLLVLLTLIAIKFIRVFSSWFVSLIGLQSAP